MTNNKYKDSLRKEMDRLRSLIEGKKKELDLERAKSTNPTIQMEIYQAKEKIKSLQRTLHQEEKKADDKDFAVISSIKEQMATEQKALEAFIRAQDTEAMTAMKRDLSLLEKRYNDLACREDFVRESVEQYQEPYISDHALLRYLERVEGIDIEGLRANLLTEDLKATMRFAKNCEIKTKNYKWIVKNMVAITLLKHK